MPRQRTFVCITIPMQMFLILHLESIRTRPAKIDRIDKPILSGSCQFLVNPFGADLCYTEITAKGQRTATAEIRQAEREISQLCNIQPVEYELIKTKALALAVMKFNACTYSREPYITQELQEIIADFEPSETIDTELLLQIEYFMLRKALNRTKESTISLHGKHQRATRKALAIQIINCA